MTKDITERLRDYAKDYTTTTYHDDLIREAVTEIESLRQQLAERDAELKRINHAINDPRVDLTITAAEAITDLRYKLDIVSSLLREASGRSSYGNWSTEFRTNVEKALESTEPEEEVK